MNATFKTKDADIIGSLAAMKRAARRARDLALATGTPLFVMRDGKVVDLNARPARCLSKSKKTAASSAAAGRRR